MLTGILLLFLSFFLHLHTVKATASQVVEVDATLSLDHGAAIAEEPFWLESIKHQGSSLYNSNVTYQVFRNVKVYTTTTLSQISLPQLSLGFWR